METECPYCGESIPESEWDAHREGRDGKRLSCGHQDLDLIKAEQEPQPWVPGGATLPDEW